MGGCFEFVLFDLEVCAGTDLTEDGAGTREEPLKVFDRNQVFRCFFISSLVFFTLEKQKTNKQT